MDAAYIEIGEDPVFGRSHHTTLHLAFKNQPLYNPHSVINRATRCAVKFNTVLSIIL